MTTLRIAAAIAVTFIFTVDAEARRHPVQPGAQAGYNTITQFCGDRVCSVGVVHRANDSPRQSAAHKRKGHRAAPMAIDANGNVQRPSHEAGLVRSKKTGATARVAPQYAGLFQSYINDLEAAGASVRFMGGYRPGRCWSGGMHPCGKALDVCQYARGVVDRRCNLPVESIMAKIAERNGLFEGGLWCSGDRGHAQVGVSAAPCGGNLYAAIARFKEVGKVVSKANAIHISARHRHRHKIRYAHR